MGRHGWAFCLGLLVGGPAAAQPPAAGEPSPPAPDLPGVIVAQSTEAKPLVTPDQKSPPAEPGPASAEPSAVVTPLPAVLPLPAAPSPVPPPCAARRNDKPTLEAISDWCKFRSRATSGHVPFPYYPPLQAWFPCEPRWLPAPCVAPPAPCAAPTAVVPTAPFPGPGPEVAPPGAPLPVPSPVTQVGCPAPGPGPDVDVLSGFMKTNDGLLFVPGVAPMACPTKQLHRVSHWRPK